MAIYFGFILFFLLGYLQERLQQYEETLSNSPEDPTALEVSLYPFYAHWV